MRSRRDHLVICSWRIVSGATRVAMKRNVVALAVVAMLSGTISSLGSEYVIGLKAINCDNGAILAELQEDAGDKEAVLTALDSAAVTMRTKLGESLSTVQKYSMPLREATTTSFEALRTYSIAMRTDSTSGAAAAGQSPSMWISTTSRPRLRTGK